MSLPAQAGELRPSRPDIRGRQIRTALLFQAREVVVCLIIAVRQQDHGTGDPGTLRHLAQCLGFMLCVLFLYNYIGVNAIFQIIKCVDMEEVPAVLVLCSGLVCL